MKGGELDPRASHHQSDSRLAQIGLAATSATGPARFKCQATCREEERKAATFAEPSADHAELRSCAM